MEYNIGKYYDLIENRFDRGLITASKYRLYTDKLMQWYFVYSEKEDD